MKEHFRYKETIVTISADDSQYIEIAKAEIIKQRHILESYIAIDPFFQTTLEPYECSPEAPDIAQVMATASSRAGIGPMGAVAGTIAYYAVDAMVDADATFAYVDNGGDIALINDRKTYIGIFAGQSVIRNLAFEIEPRDSILGICTSSGTVGPSISFGQSDAVTVISEDVSLADAMATATANRIQDKETIPEALRFAETMKNAGEIGGAGGIEGVLIIKDDAMGRWGNLPTLIKANVDEDLITQA